MRVEHGAEIVTQGRCQGWKGAEVQHRSPEAAKMAASERLALPPTSVCLGVQMKLDYSCFIIHFNLSFNVCVSLSSVLNPKHV